MPLDFNFSGTYTPANPLNFNFVVGPVDPPPDPEATTLAVTLSAPWSAPVRLQALSSINSLAQLTCDNGIVLCDRAGLPLDEAEQLPWGRIDAVDRATSDTLWQETHDRYDVGIALDYLARQDTRDVTHGLDWSVLAQQLAAAFGLPVQTLQGSARSLLAAWGLLTPARGGVTTLPSGSAARIEDSRQIPWGRGGSGPDGQGGKPADQQNDIPAPITPRPVPILEVYLMIPTVSLVRLPERTPLALLAASASLDRDSFCWTFDLTLASRGDFDLIRPSASLKREVELELNGYTWLLMIEGAARDVRFGGEAVRVTGRSVSARLAAPYSATTSGLESTARLAAQLATDALPPEWTLDWQAQDWLVPPDTHSWQTQSPIERIGRIAGAVGAVLQTALNTKDIIVTPRYPVSPWAWADVMTIPDKLLPEALITNLGMRWVEKPAVNAVDVSGQTLGGVFGRVKRAGSAGDLALPLITDALITHYDAARERGRQEMAEKGGAREVFSISSPLLPSPAAPGLFEPGQLVEIQGADSWRGQVMSVQITAQRAGTGVAKIEQQIEVERYLGD